MNQNDALLMSEAEFLRRYNPSEYARPSTSVDAAIFTVKDGSLHVLLIKRSEHPYKDSWTLVGGYIDMESDIDLMATAKRKLEEKTGVKTPYLEQLVTIGNKSRDPRGWSVTTVYFALIPGAGVELKAGLGASEIRWAKVSNGKVKEKLGFDHALLLSDSFERLRSKVLYTSLPVYLMPKTFSLRDLQKMYELILNQPLDPKSFRRRILNAEILAATATLRHNGTRPAQLYRLKKTAPTHFFMRSIEGPIRSENRASS